jgi:hypothetical protein
MHRSNTWEEFQTSDLDLSQTGVCPGDLFFRPQRNKPNSYSSYKTKGARIIAAKKTN